MLKLNSVKISFVLFLLISSYTTKAEDVNISKILTVSIVPKPNFIAIDSGTFEMTKETKLIFNKDVKDIRKVTDFFLEKVEMALGYTLYTSKNLIDSTEKNYIELSINDTLPLGEEGYTLNIDSLRVLITARNSKGLFYGIQSLLQLFPPDIESASVVKTTMIAPCITIKDSSKFSYRGLHLDVSRHFFPMSFLKKQIDVLAMLKMSVFHWHLTDDQGWRLEIKKYPKLVDVGATRIDPDGIEYKGFYSQKEAKELVEYASDRFITILPEIEMPGHSIAALTAYPEYSCRGQGHNYQVRNVIGGEKDVFCAGNDSVYSFLTDILKEVAEIFPSETIHIGGDECRKFRWEECSKCQARIKDNDLKDEFQLQSYFIHRIQDSVLKIGKNIMGWDEILEGGLAPGAKVMSWTGEKGGIEAALAGHDVVMTPGKWMYLDYIEGAEMVEPTGFPRVTTLDKTYSYNPIPDTLPKDKRVYIKGAQGNAWAENFYTEALTEYRIYPRLIAIAELTWTDIKNKNFKDFTKRLDNILMRLDLKGVNYHIPQPEGVPMEVAFVDTISLAFTTTREIDLVYTLDGTKPTDSSLKYTKPLFFNKSATLNIASILPFGKMSRVQTIAVNKEKYKSPTSELNSKNSLEKGLLVSVSNGDFKDLADTSKIVKVDFIAEAKNLNSVRCNPETPSILRYNGYINIETDGVYYFSSNVDLLKIGGEVIIENHDLEQARRYHRLEGAVALKRGYHKIEIVMINGTFGGWPVAWSQKLTEIVLIKKGIKEEYKKINNANLLYQPDKNTDFFFTTPF